MKAFDAGFAERLAAGATTLCRCWLIIRTDGTRQGFTDHDGPIVFDETLFDPAAGLTTTADNAGSGLAVGGFEVEGALTAASLDEGDLSAGVYDGARVELWAVDWRDSRLRARLRIGTLGEVTQADGMFRAEVRGLAQALDEVTGRVIGPACDADLGDPRCGIGLDAHRRESVVKRVEAADRLVIGLLDVAEGWLTGGVLTYLSGANAGQRSEIRRHGQSGAEARLELWRAPAHPLGADDRVAVTPGCDKTHATCRAKFANGHNFRGFPFVPGNDFTLFARGGLTDSGLL